MAREKLNRFRVTFGVNTNVVREVGAKDAAEAEKKARKDYKPSSPGRKINSVTVEELKTSVVPTVKK